MLSEWNAGDTFSRPMRRYTLAVGTVGWAAADATGAVIHTHSDYCVAVSCHNAPLPGFHYLVGLFGGSDVPCVPYSTFGSETLAEAAAVALKDRTACLLANHGMIARGRDLDTAVKTAQRLEIMCRQYVLSRALGEPSRLTDADWEDFSAQIRKIRYG